jgi:hypothetical protein
VSRKCICIRRSALRYGRTANPATRVWERNPGYAAHQAEFATVPIGKPPLPWRPKTRTFYPELLHRRGGVVERARTLARDTAMPPS